MAVSRSSPPPAAARCPPPLCVCSANPTLAPLPAHSNKQKEQNDDLFFQAAMSKDASMVPVAGETQRPWSASMQDDGKFFGSNQYASSRRSEVEGSHRAGAHVNTPFQAQNTNRLSQEDRQERRRVKKEHEEQTKAEVAAVAAAMDPSDDEFEDAAGSGHDWSDDDEIRGYPGGDPRYQGGSATGDSADLAAALAASVSDFATRVPQSSDRAALAAGALGTTGLASKLSGSLPHTMAMDDGMRAALEESERMNADADQAAMERAIAESAGAVGESHVQRRILI